MTMVANPPNPDFVDPVLPTYPNELKDKSYFSFIRDIAWALWTSIAIIPGVLESRVCPLVEKVSLP
jgi:hypothetical protein